MGVDIGPQTISNFIIDTSKAKTIFWNGPLGVCEVEGFRGGTSSLARAVASSDALSTAVGWDTVSEIIRAGVEGKITHLSMGGRASLDFIQGKELPAISALEKKAK